MAENVKNEGRKKGSYENVRDGGIYSMWEVLPDGFPGTKCSNHLSMRSSLAIRLTNTKIPQLDAIGCWHSLYRALPILRFLSFRILLRSQTGVRNEILPLWNGFLSCGLPKVWNSWLIIDFSKAGWEPWFYRSIWKIRLILRDYPWDYPYVACKIWEFLR